MPAYVLVAKMDTFWLMENVNYHLWFVTSPALNVLDQMHGNVPNAQMIRNLLMMDTVFQLIVLLGITNQTILTADVIMIVIAMELKDVLLTNIVKNVMLYLENSHPCTHQATALLATLIAPLVMAQIPMIVLLVMLVGF
jgi:hypothetical protein